MRSERHIPVAAAVVLGGICILGVAAWMAPAGATGERPGRFTMSPAEGGGFVRLDTETGRMALCHRRDGEWGCHDLAEPGRGLDDEIDRLRADNKRLKAEIREMEEIMLGDKRRGATHGRSGPNSGPNSSSGAELKLPSEQDIENVFDYTQRMLRKFREKWKEIEADNKATPL